MGKLSFSPLWTLSRSSSTPRCHPCAPFFFFNDTATTEIYTLSLHDALPILVTGGSPLARADSPAPASQSRPAVGVGSSEEHTSELQSQSNLVCRLLLDKKIWNSACL